MAFWLNIPFFGNFREHVAKLLFELFSGLKFELCHKMEVAETQIARERESHSLRDDALLVFFRTAALRVSRRDAEE